jgi:hypothetical protein
MSKWRIPFVLISAIIALVALGRLFLPVPAAAENEPASLKNVVLTVYPEYDDPLGLKSPTVLVMLDGQIEGAESPTTIRFLVPNGAIMYSAGSGPRENYVGGPPNRKASDISGWDEISYELQTDYFVVEYYVVIQASPDKAFSIEFIPLYHINGFVALVQKPRQADNFNVVTQSQPVTQQEYIDAQGFNIRHYSYNTLESHQSISLSISYTKKNPAPSLEIKEASSSGSNRGPLVAAVVVGSILLGIVVYWAVRKSSSARSSRRKNSSGWHASEPDGGRFCTECGTELDKSQRFCAKCGTKRR